MTAPENHLIHRLLCSGDPNPPASSLLSQGFTVRCFCGAELRTWAEFVEHDRRTEEYYRWHLDWLGGSGK